MNLEDLRDTHSWQRAIELGPQLVRLAEELPASEQMGLSWQLRQSMVELPAAIAADLQSKSSTRQAAAFRLIAALDLIEKVYPALDTAGLRADAESLVEWVASSHFADRINQPPAAEAAPAETRDYHSAPTSPVIGSTAIPMPAPKPTSVAVVAEDSADRPDAGNNGNHV